MSSYESDESSSSLSDLDHTVDIDDTDESLNDTDTDEDVLPSKNTKQPTKQAASKAIYDSEVSFLLYPSHRSFHGSASWSPAEKHTHFSHHAPYYSPLMNPKSLKMKMS